MKNLELAIKLQDSVKKLKYVKIVDEMRGLKRKKTFMIESSSEDEENRVIKK